MTETDKQRAERVMGALDKMPPDLRAVIHEFGVKMVLPFLGAGLSAEQVRKACEDFRAARSPIEETKP